MHSIYVTVTYMQLQYNVLSVSKGLEATSQRRSLQDLLKSEAVESDSLQNLEDTHQS